MRSHLALQVRDVPRSVAFYERVFGVAPQKRTASYAKFDLHEPPLNFALVASEAPSRVSHLGIEAADADEFAALRARLGDAGVETREEGGSRCCYALQDKLWFRDPDDNAWEVFLVHAQLPVPEDPAAEAGGCCGAEASAGSEADATESRCCA